MASFLDLPDEIILAISDHVPVQALGRLVATCQLLHNCLSSALYRKGLEDDATVLDWAATVGNQRTVQRVLHCASPSPRLIERAINIAIVRLLLEQGRPPWDPATSSEGAFSSPLFIAGMCRNLEMVQMLLDKGASPAEYPDDDIGFLVYFCTAWEIGPNNEEPSRQHSQAFDPSILQLLVQNGLPLNSSEIVYHAMSLGCKVGVISLLIDLGLDPNARSHIWNTALYYVLGNHRDDWEGCVALIQNCLEHGVDINLRDANGETVLYTAAEKAHPAVIRAVLAAGAEVHVLNTYGQTSIQCAAMRDDVDLEILQTFFDFDPEMPRGAAGSLEVMLIQMVTRRKLDCISLLLSKGLELIPDMSPSILVLAAAAVGDAETVQQLLQDHQGLDFTVYDGNRSTALMSATRWGYDEVIRILMSHMDMVDVDVSCDWYENSLLHLAMYSGKESTASILMEQSDSFNNTNASNCTPLTIAVQHQSATIVRRLLEHGSDVMVTDSTGKTLLQNAIERGDTAIVEILLDSGAFCATLDNAHQTPMSLAVTNGKADILQLLRE
ncbi:ankyrin repeat-containing domain protein [Aspergillus carlsbadensis]|nr:ankyrin repeat-containing domain protein [Aspergillus carlsbadensis]